MAASGKMSTPNNPVRKYVEITPRIGVNITRFRDQNWFHIFQQSNRSKVVSLNAEDLASLFTKETVLKKAGYSLYKKATGKAEKMKGIDSESTKSRARKRKFAEKQPIRDSSSSSDASNCDENWEF